MSNSGPAMRGRRRPRGSKKLQVWVTHVDLSEFSSGISNGGPTQPLKARGSPKGSVNKHKVQDYEEGSPKRQREQGHSGEGSGARKKGRPKGSFSLKRKAESSKEKEGPPRKRGRPKGSANKNPWLTEREVSSEELEESSEANGGQSLPKRGRGRPKKDSTGVKVVKKAWVEDVANGGYKSSPRGRGRPSKGTTQDLSTDHEQGVLGVSQSPKRGGPGRPKGSPNKTYPLVSRNGRAGRPRKEIKTEPVAPTAEHKKEKRGRPRKYPPKELRPNKEPAKRGRPRKNPSKELMRPKVWKPLGRPRIYPRVTPDPVLTPCRGRGRPRKLESKKGAHLRKSFPAAPQPSATPRKRGRPVKDPATPKRGRPKGSLNKKNAPNQTTQVDGGLLEKHHQSEKSGLPDKQEECEAGDAGQGWDELSPVQAVDTGEVGSAEEGGEEAGFAPAAAPRKRGRPVKDPATPKRGRPKGSLNKKNAPNQTTQVDGGLLEKHHQSGLPDKQEECEAGDTGQGWDELSPVQAVDTGEAGSVEEGGGEPGFAPLEDLSDLTENSAGEM